MAGDKRKQRGGGNSGDRDAKRRRYDPKQMYRSGEIRGPGIWFTCDRRKEPKAVGEAYDLLNEVADELYPETAQNGQADGDNTDDEDVEESIEDAIARELASIQPKGRESKKKMRFSSVKTNTECLIWVGCTYPCDPVVLTHEVVRRLQAGGPVRTKHLARMTPVSATAHADIDSLKRIAYVTLSPLFAPAGYTDEQRAQDPVITYRIEPNLRNHSGSLNRDKINAAIGDVVRDLTNPDWQWPSIEAAKSAATESEANPEVVEVEASKDSLAAVQEGSEAEKGDLVNDAVGPSAGSGANALKEANSEDADPVAEMPQSKPAREPLPTVRRRSKVDLKTPEYVIMVSALKGMCGISCVRGFDQGKKFNIQTLSGGNQPDPKKEAEKAAKKAAEDALREEMQAEEEHHRNQALEAVAAATPTEG